MSTFTGYSALCPFLLVAVRVLYLAANNPGDFGLAMVQTLYPNGLGAMLPELVRRTGLDD